MSDMASNICSIIRQTVAFLLLSFSASSIAQDSDTIDRMLPAGEEFDGSFQLDNGSIITGGKFVEGGVTLWLYFDTDNPEVGAAFERVEDTSLFKSLPPYGKIAPNPDIELEFFQDPSGHFQSVEWRKDGRVHVGKRIFPHTSREVEFASTDGTIIRGRLLEPLCRGPRPAIIPVHGSGPVDRYGGTYHLFFVREGMSVLAYDKRGYTSIRDEWSEPDLAEMSEDARASAEFLVSQPGIDPSKIGMMGSSQGGWTAPPAAIGSAAVDYLILRAGAALTQTETYIHEVRQEWRNDGLTGVSLDNAIAFLREALEYAEADRPLTHVDQLAEPYVDSRWYINKIGEGPVSEHWSSDWWDWARRNMAFTPLPVIATSELPILWFLGEDDEAVPYVATRTALENAFRASPSEDETIISIPRAPHSFLVPQKDGSVILAPEFFGGMAAWLEKRKFSDPQCFSGSK